MTRTLGIWWHERARALKAEGRSHSEIARLFGVTPGAVTKAVHPEVYKGEGQRAKERKRNAEKRRWERENYRGECQVCGAQTSRPDHLRCVKHHSLRDQGWRRRKEIQERWAAGESMPVIWTAMGMTKGHLSQEMHRMREAGWDLPYRYNIKDRKRVAA